MGKTFLPGGPEIQAAAKAAGINVPYYGAEVVGESYRFYLYGGRTVTVRALPGIGDSGSQRAQRAAPQRPKPAVTFSGDLASMSKAELIELAAKLGINPRSKATKAELIRQIKEIKP
jgi:phage terminase small subunit